MLNWLYKNNLKTLLEFNQRSPLSGNRSKIWGEESEFPMFLPFEPGVVRVESDVPFCDVIEFCLSDKHISLATLQHDERYNLPYLAWETVRLGGNPFLQTGTGFEGYFVGRCRSSDEVLHEILAMCHHMLDSIARCYRMEYGFRSRLMKTLMGETYDPDAIELWSVKLGATLAGLRCNLHYNEPASDFRLDTYRRVKEHPVIEYQINEHTIHQEYEVCPGSGEAHPIPVFMNNLNAHDQDAWLVATSIGRFGHPLVRQYLQLRCYHY